MAQAQKNLGKTKPLLGSSHSGDSDTQVLSILWFCYYQNVIFKSLNFFAL